MGRQSNNGYDDATTGGLGRPTDISDTFDRPCRYEGCPGGGARPWQARPRRCLRAIGSRDTIRLVTELRQFRYFLEIARRGSFTAASKTLHVTQSALSEQIMQLERELDCRLFDRGRHGARMTVAGERLFERAGELMRISGEIDRSIGHFGKSRRRTLRLGMTMSPVLSWFPDVVAELEREEGDLELTIEDITTPEIYMRVSTGELDLGIISTSDPIVAGLNSPGVVVTRLFEDEFVLLVPVGHPFIQLDSVPLHLLSQERLIAFPRMFSLRVVTDALLQREGVIVTPTIETGWLEMAIRFVGAGIGVLLAPRATMAEAWPTNVRAVEIAAHNPPTRILEALHREDAPLLDLIERLLALALARIEATPTVTR